MTKMAAVEKAVEQMPEKVEHKAPEKRRALGRGLESLLPGPRVVRAAQTSPGNAKETIDLQGVVEEMAAPSSGPATAPLLATDARNGAPMSEASAAASAPQRPVSQALEPAEPRSAGQPGAAVPTYSLEAQAEGRIPSNLVANIPLDAIDKNPYQTRLIFEEEALEELADSIKRSGVVQPVVVRPGEEDGRYILVLGERRLRASKMAGKETIPAIVRRVSELQAAELTIVENMQREDLNCMEQAEAYRVLSKDFQLTQADIAQRVGVSRESVSNYMRLLKLPVKVQDYLIAGGLGFSEAKVLLQLENLEQLERLADMAIEKCMNVEQLRDAVMRLDGYLGPKPGLDPNEKLEEKKRKGGARWIDPNVRAAQVEIQTLLGMRVRIRDRKGKGKIVIEYATVDDYERVVGMLRGK